MTELELAARDAVSWVRESHPVCDSRPEDDLALLVHLALGGFYYDQALTDNDMLRVTRDPNDLKNEVAADLAELGVSASGFLEFSRRYPDWQAKLREIIDRLNKLRPSA